MRNEINTFPPSSTSEIRGKKIILTGGAGFIGHNLAIELKKLGAEPHVIDGLQVNHIGFHTSNYINGPNADLYIAYLNDRLRLLRDRGIHLHIFDLRDYHAISKTFSNIQPDIVVHLAAVAHANRSNKDPYSTFDHSFRTLENVLDANRNAGAHIIYLSSSMVYGDFDGESVTEDRVCNPKGIYGALKFGAEKLVIGYNQVFETPYTIIRPSALYGERCVSRRVGQAFIENAIAGKDLTVNGDGMDSLDFTYIRDFMAGLIQTMTVPEAKGETFNLTYGNGRTLVELAELVLKEFPGSKLKHAPRDVLMPERGTLNIEKARRILGYKPEYPIERGFAEYIAWYREFANDHPTLFSSIAQK